MNINECSIEGLLEFDNLIIGTPTLGEGELPGLSVDCGSESWEEVIESIEEADFTGKTIALFGLGDQESYPDDFSMDLVNSMTFFLILMQQSLVVGQMKVTPLTNQLHLKMMNL